MTSPVARIKAKGSEVTEVCLLDGESQRSCFEEVVNVARQRTSQAARREAFLMTADCIGYERTLEIYLDALRAIQECWWKGELLNLDNRFTSWSKRSEESRGVESEARMQQRCFSSIVRSRRKKKQISNTISTTLGHEILLYLHPT